MPRILGIDPGLTRTGWGMIEAEGNQLRFIDCGVLSTKPSAPLAERLRLHHHALNDIITRFRPDSAALEETFVNVSGSSTLKLGQARGALLLTLTLHGLETGEYAANLVKKTVTGSGHAEKSQVSQMVRLLLPGCQAKQADACDALAVAITHAQHRMSRVLMSATA